MKSVGWATRIFLSPKWAVNLTTKEESLGVDLTHQFSSVVQLCPTLMDCSRPGFPVHHQLPELAQTHVHRVGDGSTISSSVVPLWCSSCPSPLPILLWRHLQAWKQQCHLRPQDKGSPTSKKRMLSTEMHPLPPLTLIQRFTRLNRENPERTSENSVSTGSLRQFAMSVLSSRWNNSLQKNKCLVNTNQFEA